MRYCSAALRKKPPRQPLPERCETGRPGDPRGAKWKRWIWAVRTKSEWGRGSERSDAHG